MTIWVASVGGTLAGVPSAFWNWAGGVVGGGRVAHPEGHEPPLLSMTTWSNVGTSAGAFATSWNWRYGSVASWTPLLFWSSTILLIAVDVGGANATPFLSE